MSISLRVFAVLSYLIAGLGLLLGACVWVAHGALNAENSYDRVEVISTLVLPVLAISVANGVFVLGFRRVSWIQCLAWISPTFILAGLTFLILIFGHGPQVR